VLKKASFYAIVLGFLCASAYAQFWPIPNYTTPDTPVLCLLCEGSALNLPTPGWHDPVVRYVGRFVSSEYVGDFQQGYRTARAGGIVFNPDASRVGVKLGNGAATFSTTNFLSLLEAHTPLTSVAALGVSPINRFNGPFETYLAFERYFYAEASGALWTLAITDGQDRLNGFDMDDRGLVYLAYRQFGWGVASDLSSTLASTSPAPLMSSWQDKNAQKNWGPVTQAYWFKDGADYYALAQNQSQLTTHLFKVPSYATVSEVNPDLKNFTGAFGKPVLFLSRGNSNKSLIVPTSRTQVYIYDNHNIVTNGAPVKTIDYSDGSLSDPIFDGTNWWVSLYSYNGFHLTLSRISPSGNDYVRTDFPTSYGGPISMRYKDGYLSVVTGDGNGSNIRLYKITSGSPVELPTVDSINAYFKDQTGFAPHALHMTIGSANPMVVNGKLYLIVNGDGLGDVYQIRTDDTVNIAFQGTAGAANPNAPARAAGDVFYGDAVKMTGTLSSGGTGGTMNWNFGAPHDPANTQTGAFGLQVTHQYTGLTKSDTAAPLTVTGTNPANGVTGTAQLTLKTGTARVKYGSTGTKYLAGSGTPVVLGDSFYDASDGDVGGHYVEWRIGADLATITAPGFVPVYGDSATAQSVGTCGQHTLSMTAHYGYAAFGANNVDYPSALSAPFTYNVAAFVPGADVTYNSTTGNEEFFSTSRAAAVLAGATFTYTWDVVDSNGAAVSTIAPQSGTATSVDTIPHYPVSKALFTQAGYKGRLTLSVSGVDPCSQTGAPMPAQQATSGALVTPDAQLNAICASGVCSYAIISPSNVMLSDAWTFAWTATGGSPASGSGPSLTTSYLTAGNFPVQVVVTNKTGLTKTLNYTANITTPASQCPTLSTATTFIEYQGVDPSSSCTVRTTCQASEQIQFDVGFFRTPDQGCLNTMTYSWQVDGSGAGTDSTLMTSFASNGTHVVTCTLKTGSQSVNLTSTVSIGTVPTPPVPPVQPPQPPVTPPTGQCGTLTNNNVYINYNGQSATCASPGSAVCSSSDVISFQLLTFAFTPGSCAVTYTWSFDGVAGAPSSSNQITHTFTTPGNHTVSCNASNGSTHGVASATVNIGGTQPTSCPTLVSGANVSFGYSGATSGCGGNNNHSCVAGEQITLFVNYNNYNTECGTHHYSWTIDGSPISATTDTTVQVLTAGTHTIAVTIDNGNVPTTTLTKTLTINNGAKPTYTFDFTVTALPLPAFSYAFTVAVTPDANKPTQWQWDFGDGSPVVTAGSPQTHTFPDDKQYTITVTAVDGIGGSVSHTLPAAPAKRRGVRH
jgi:hypothetical protein